VAGTHHMFGNVDTCFFMLELMWLPSVPQCKKMWQKSLNMMVLKSVDWQMKFNMQIVNPTHPQQFKHVPIK
jgi:hypothetical protein